MSKTSWALVSQYAQALSLPIQCTLGSMAGGILVKSIDCRDVILKATFDGRGTGYPIRFGDCVVENETALNKYLIEIFSGHSIETLESLQETMATWGASRIKEAAAASPDLLRGNGVDNPHLPADYRQRLEAAANSRKDVLTLPRSLDPWETARHTWHPQRGSHPRHRDPADLSRWRQVALRSSDRGRGPGIGNGRSARDYDAVPL
jgi:hypothetical protein